MLFMVVGGVSGTSVSGMPGSNFCFDNQSGDKNKEVIF